MTTQDPTDEDAIAWMGQPDFAWCEGMVAKHEDGRRFVVCGVEGEWLIMNDPTKQGSTNDWDNERRYTPDLSHRLTRLAYEARASTVPGQAADLDVTKLSTVAADAEALKREFFRLHDQATSAQARGRAIVSRRNRRKSPPSWGDLVQSAIAGSAAGDVVPLVAMREAVKMADAYYSIMDEEQATVEAGRRAEVMLRMLDMIDAGETLEKPADRTCAEVWRELAEHGLVGGDA